MALPPIPFSQLTAPADATRKFRLLEIVRLRMRERRFSPRTQRAYVDWIRRYVLFHDRRDPRDLGAEEVRAFLSDLAVRRGVSASTQNQAHAALTFLYDAAIMRPLARIEGIAPARRPKRVPVVLSQREIRLLLEQLSGPARVCASLMYGSGLRLIECLRRRVKDVDFDRREIVVRFGKGGKDRRTPLADASVAGLKRQMEHARDVYHVDRRTGVDGVGLDASLMRKYPHASREWA